MHLQTNNYKFVILLFISDTRYDYLRSLFERLAFICLGTIDIDLDESLVDWRSTAATVVRRQRSGVLSPDVFDRHVSGKQQM